MKLLQVDSFSQIKEQEIFQAGLKTFMPLDEPFYKCFSISQ
jgi:hypothetical protein